MRDWLEFIPVWLTAKFLGVLPRRASRAIGMGIGRGAYRVHRRLRRVGERNLQLAFPQMDKTERRHILRGVFITLGRQLADFAHLPKINRDNVEQWVSYVGLENYLQ